MSGTTSRAFSAGPGLTEVGRTSNGVIQTRRMPWRTRAGLLHRGREGTGAGRWSCPGCGLQSPDPVAARLGFCERCQDFTGMCGAGRKIICPDVMTMTSWHTPCTSLGIAAWEVGDGSGDRIVLLCAAHDGELTNGQASWIRRAVRLEDLAGR